MSPASLRRYRAERLLREEFDRLRARVLERVTSRLCSTGVHLDRADLESCYAQAWQGLYGALLRGDEIANPAGWLVVVTFRRAIEEHRSRRRAPVVGEADVGPSAASREAPPHARDPVDELEARSRLRHVFEGLLGRLSVREREAAVLCYLHGLTRAQAAERMGLSERRMRKLMEGHRPGEAGVAAKVGALVEAVRDGAWCEEQASLMRALAYGILDPEGERYRLAVAHRRDCPACRAYVTSLRGLAAALPPVLPPSGIGAALALVRGTTPLRHGAGRGVLNAGPHSGVLHGGPGLGPLSASGAAGASSAGGSWLLAGGPFGAKLAVGCLLALGVGAGCAALGGIGSPDLASSHQAPRRAQAAATAQGGAVPSSLFSPARQRLFPPPAGAAGRPGRQPVATAQHPGAEREFGPEKTAGLGERQPSRGMPRAQSASSSRLPIGLRIVAAPGGDPPSRPARVAPSSAEREFAPG